MATVENPVAENKGVTGASSRLAKRENSYRKMKVYPGMFMKTQGLKKRPKEYPGMLMKRKPVIVANRECH
jgi:hypothetical protein